MTKITIKKGLFGCLGAVLLFVVGLMILGIFADPMPSGTPPPAAATASPGTPDQSGSLSVVIDPVPAKNLTFSQPESDWQNLSLGCVYRLEKVTVLCVAPQVDDPIEGIKQMRKIAAGCQIRITGARLVGPTKWYLVEVYSRDAVTYLQPIATGWINSVGLVAQNLPLVNGGK